VPTNTKEAVMELIEYVGLAALLLTVFLWSATFEAMWEHRGEIGRELRATLDEIAHRR
jgi:hypothetical protein